MKQSIRLTRATLYFKFMAFRDLTEQEPRLKECSKRGKDMVKLTLKCYPGPSGFS